MSQLILKDQPIIRLEMSSFFKGLNVTTAYMMRCNKNDKLNTLFCYGLVILRKQLAPHVRASPAGVFARKNIEWVEAVGGFVPPVASSTMSSVPQGCHT